MAPEAKAGPRRNPPPAEPVLPPAPPPQGLLCDAFTKAGNGDWVATKDVMVPGPSGIVLIKAGVPVDDEMQERLDDRCGTGKVLRPRQV